MKTVLMVGVQMVRAIEKVHETGFIHRDIKPSNITLGLGHRTNCLRLIDFGLAKKYSGNQVGFHMP